MSTTTIHTIDGVEVELETEDLAKLRAISAITLERIHLIGDSLFAERKDGQLHPVPLDVLIGEVPHVVPRTPGVNLPQTGAPQGTLARFLKGGSTGALPRLIVNGASTYPSRVERVAGHAKVPLVDKRQHLVGWCYLSGDAYDALVTNPKTRVDRLQWQWDAEAQVVSTRSKAGSEVVRMDVKALLKMLRRGTTPLSIQLLEPANG